MVWGFGGLGFSVQGLGWIAVGVKVGGFVLLGVLLGGENMHGSAYSHGLGILIIRKCTRHTFDSDD